MDLQEILRSEPPCFDIFNVLGADLEECVERHNANPESQFWRRTLVRTMFAMVEGINNLLKQTDYSYHERSIRPVYYIYKALKLAPTSPILAQVQPEWALLLMLDKSVTIKANGKCETKDAFTPMVSSIRFMFDMASRIYQSGFQPDYSAVGWRDLQDGISVRNRLMHPKTPESLNVTEEELGQVQRGSQWFLDSTAAMMSQHVGIIKKMHADLPDSLKELPREKLLALIEATNSSNTDEGKHAGHGSC